MSFLYQLKRRENTLEDWRYTDLNKIKARVDQLPPNLGGMSKKIDRTSPTQQKLIFIDGQFNVEQSSFGDLPSSTLEGDPEKGYRLTLAGQTCLIAHPVELLFVTTRQSPAETSLTLAISLGPNGRLSLLERHDREVGCLPNQTQSVHLNVELMEQAKFVHAKISKNAGIHFANTDVHVAEGAYYDQFTLLEDGHLHRVEMDVFLEGPLAQCALRGVMMLDEDNHADIKTHVSHQAPHGVSRQYFKTVAGGRAHGIYQGKIVVGQKAQKTDGQQLSRALLLSDQAEVDQKPALEIFADDVRCSHGSTMGDLDQDMLFYLRARGFSENEARSLLVRAFAEDVLESIQVAEWRDICRAEIERWLHDRA